MERVVHKAIKNYDFISTCYHESGHTILALLRNFKVSTVLIKNKYSGVTMYTTPEFSFNEKNNKKIAEGEVYVLYSGIESEKILYSKLDSFNNVPMSIKIGSTVDFEYARYYIKTYSLAPGNDNKKYKKTIKTNIRKKLTKHWGDVGLISNALLKNKKIGFRRIKTILTKYSVNKEFWKKKFEIIERQF